jgi:hypothetical protein
VLLFSINCVIFGHLSSTFFIGRFKHPTHGILFLSYQLCCCTCSCLWNFFNIHGIFLDDFKVSFFIISHLLLLVLFYFCKSKLLLCALFF